MNHPTASKPNFPRMPPVPRNLQVCRAKSPTIQAKKIIMVSTTDSPEYSEYSNTTSENDKNDNITTTKSAPNTGRSTQRPTKTQQSAKQNITEQKVQIAKQQCNEQIKHNHPAVKSQDIIRRHPQLYKEPDKSTPTKRKRKKSIKQSNSTLTASHRPSQQQLLDPKNKSKKISKTSSDSEDIWPSKARIEFENDTELHFTRSQKAPLIKRRNYYDYFPNSNFIQNQAEPKLNQLTLNHTMTKYYQNLLKHSFTPSDLKHSHHDSKHSSSDHNDINSSPKTEVTQMNLKIINNDLYPNFKEPLAIPIPSARKRSNRSEDEIRTLSNTNFIRFYVNQNDSYDIPPSFVPDYSMDQLKKMYVSFGSDTPPLFVKNDSKQSNFPFFISLSTKNTPLSLSISAHEKQFRNIQGISFKSMSAYPFFSEQLFPFDSDVSKLKDQLINADSIGDKQNIILQTSLELLPPLLNPYHSIDYETIPILTGHLTVKINNTEYSNTPVKLYRHFLSINDNKNKLDVKIEITKDFKFQLSQQTPNSFLIISSKDKYLFKSDSDITQWVNKLNDLLNNHSVDALNNHLFILSVYDLSCSTIHERLIATLSSPFTLFSICLLSCSEFQPHVLSLYNILKSQHCIDYYLKLIIMSLFSTENFNEVFLKENSIYSRSLLNLFKAVSGKWLRLLILNIENMEIPSAADLLHLIYSIFSLLDVDGFYIVRALILYSFAICNEDSCPIVPFVNFFLKLVQTTSPDTNLEPFYNLKLFSLSSLDLLNNRYFYELVPFVNKIASIVPTIQGNPKDQMDQAKEIYDFLSDEDNLKKLLPQFDSFCDMHPTQRPLVHALYQNLAFLLRI